MPKLKDPSELVPKLWGDEILSAYKANLVIDSLSRKDTIRAKFYRMVRRSKRRWADRFHRMGKRLDPYGPYMTEDQWEAFKADEWTDTYPD
jgi:hypothetical protein